MGVTMGDKPSYLGLLNAIAVGELGGEALFCAWAETTPDDDVRGVLRTVQLREAEHARSFAKRLDELGYGVLDKPDPSLAGRVAIARSTEMSDCEKFERLGFAKEPDGPDIFSRFFDDTTIDPTTGALMGRYVAEERDTGRLLRSCYAVVKDRTPHHVAGAEMAATHAPDAALVERLDRIECAVMALAEQAAAQQARAQAKADAKAAKGKGKGTKAKGEKRSTD